MATRTIGTEIVLAGEKQFNDAMKSVNNNLKNLRSDMSLVSATFEDNADSMEALTAKQKVLQSSVDQHRAKVDALRQMYERQVAVSGENSAAADKYRQELNKATVALLKEESALRKNEAALSKAQAEAEDAGSALKKFAEASEDAGDAAEKAAADIAKMSQNAEKADSALSGIAGGIGSVAGSLLQAGAAVVAAGAGLSVAGVTALVSVANESAAAAKAAQEAGETLTATQQQWLTYSNQLDDLNNSASLAKNALAKILLPTLKDVSKQGSLYLKNFAQSMDEAGGDTQKQAQVMSEYVSKGISMIMNTLPEYAGVGKALLQGIVDGFSEQYPELADTGIELIFDFLDAIIDGAPAAGEVGLVLFEKLLNGIESRGPDLVTSGVKLLTKFSIGLIENAPALIPVAGELLYAFVMALADGIPELAATATDMVVALADYLTTPGNLQEIASTVAEVGVTIATAIWNSLTSSWETLSARFPSLFAGLSAGLQYAGSGGAGSIPGFKAGLDYVPYDNYLARLHRGEMVLTAEEASSYRNGQTGGNTKIFNMTIQTQSLSQEDMDMLVDYVNEKLGEDLE